MDPEIQELVTALAVVVAATFVVIRFLGERRARRCPACGPETPRVPRWGVRSGVRSDALKILPPT